MHEHPVGDLAGRLGHQRPDRREHDLRVAVRVRARVEERRHQGVRVELALEVERRVGRPGVPDRADREDELAHARRRLRPRHRVAPGDVRLDLRAEPEREAPARQRLDVVGLERDRHRVAREGDDDRRADLDRLGALGGDRAGEERDRSGSRTPTSRRSRRARPGPPPRRRRRPSAGRCPRRPSSRGPAPGPSPRSRASAAARARASSGVPIEPALRVARVDAAVAARPRQRRRAAPPATRWHRRRRAA